MDPAQLETKKKKTEASSIPIIAKIMTKSLAETGEALHYSVMGSNRPRKWRHRGKCAKVYHSQKKTPPA